MKNYIKKNIQNKNSLFIIIFLSGIFYLIKYFLLDINLSDYQIINYNIYFKLFRNLFLSDNPEFIDPIYDSCNDEELIKDVTIVMTVKDTCSQGIEIITYLYSMFPKMINFIYVYPDFIGCNLINVSNSLFPNFKILKINDTDSPVKGFLEAQSYITTPYSLLMHNDAYPMDKQMLCELYRALQNNSKYPFSVPQIYEKSNNNIIVPHAHHKNLHIMNNFIKYDVDFDILTNRHPKDFIQSEQINFMEDHAYMARTNIYHLYLDEYASYTMEYIDNILAMRRNKTVPLYVPSARVLFDVSIEKFTWKDIPYFSYKRSEEIAHTVRNYLSNKWNVNFLNSGMWNYIKYFYFNGNILTYNNIPENYDYQMVLIYSWFQSIGFNRYNNMKFPEFLHMYYSGLFENNYITIGRNIYEYPYKHYNSYNNKCNDESENSHNAYSILNSFNKTNVLFDIDLEDEYIPITFNYTNHCDYNSCGMLILDNDVCHCFNYISHFYIKDTILNYILDKFKLPSRSINFLQMKYLKKHIEIVKNITYFCDRNSECSFQFPSLSKNARLIKWSWF